MVKRREENTNSLFGLRFVIISSLIVFHMGYPSITGALSVSFFILVGFIIGYSNYKKHMVFNLKNTFLFE